MPHSAATLHIPQPCAQSWVAMTPASGGRHCATCQKTVVDFTQKTDAEILAYLARAASSQTCGRFRASQLHRPLALPAGPSRWRAWLTALLTTGGLLGSERASAQRATSGPAPIVTLPSTAPAPAASVIPDATETIVQPGSRKLLTLRGVVTDTKNSTLPGATVLLKGTTQGTSTDANGEFVLPVKGEASNPVLVISSVGFSTREQQVIIGATGAAIPVQVKLEEEAVGLLILPRPYPWHPRAFLNWSNYWLTRPFRR